MIETAVLVALLIVAPLVLLIAAWFWVVRGGKSVRTARRLGFVAGLSASSAAFVSQWLLHWYLGQAHLGFWPEVDAILGVGTVMLVAACGGFITGWFGKGYGRVTACVASLLVAISWWLAGMAAV